jgi:hypothetical protein
MVSACLIAACAANGKLSAEQKLKESRYNQYFTKDFELYYKVKLRKYYHFEPMTLITKETTGYSKFFGGHFCHSDVLLRPVQVEAKSIAVEHHFTLRADLCKNGVDNYIKENLSRYTESSIWNSSDIEALDLYITELNRKYGIDLDPKSLKYTNQFCWEVDTDVH